MNIQESISAIPDNNVAEDVSRHIRLLAMSQTVNLIGSWEWDLQTNKLLWTDAMFLLRAIPVSADNLISIEDNYKYVHEADRKMVKEKFESLKLKRNVEFEYRIVPPGGQTRIISAWAALFRDEKGEARFIRGTSQDVTKLRHIERQLNELNQVYEYAEEMAKIGNWQWKLKKNEFIFSKNLFRLLGCEPDEFEPSYESFMRFVHTPDKEKVSAAHKNIQQNLTVTSFDFRIKRKDGEVRHVKSIGKMIANEESEIIILGTLQDITEEVILLGQLEQKNKELENSNEELACFSYVASHDLQEPLRKIQTFSKLIREKDGTSLSYKGKDYFKRIESASQRMQVLIDDLLTFSRTTNYPRKFTNTNLNNILDEAKQELKYSIEEKKAVIESVSLPVANVIAFQFRQLLVNLITNSIKYSKPGIPPHISITCQVLEGKNIQSVNANKSVTYYQFCVIDNGIGFEQQYAQKIFELFQRLHGRFEYPGTGLGLAICKKIAENHNGFIEAKSVLNEGATFFVYLPCLACHG